MTPPPIIAISVEILLISAGCVFSKVENRPACCTLKLNTAVA
jgi:hypothetical protein